MQKQIRNTTFSEQFQNRIEKIVERDKIDTSNAHTYRIENSKNVYVIFDYKWIS
jgi:hypothetical protein